MSQPEFIDWRVWKAARVAADTKVFGSELRKGTPIYVSSMTRDSSGVMRAFITPSPVALALNISIEAGLEAERLKPQLWVRAKGSLNPHDEDVVTTYSYFEQCMISVTFAFQSLEAFANQLVAESQQGAIEVERRDGKRLWTPDEVERQCSTEEKFADILPRIGPITTPKGKKPWQNFKKLKGLRDSTVHLKAGDQYIRQKEDRESLYHRFLNHSPKEFPRWAIALIRHYTPTGTDAWVKAAEDRLDRPKT